MNARTEQASGISLLMGSILMIITMVFHPYSGDLEHLSRVSTAIIITHSLAILSIPFLVFGFRGVLKRLYDEPLFPVFAFVTLSVGLVAVLCAGALNGLVLPIFVETVRETSSESASAVALILRYNMAMNHAFDYIFIGFTCLSVISWSIAILRTRAYPLWTGYAGLLIALSAVVLPATGFNLLSVHGFGMFIFGFTAWAIILGMFMVKTDKKTVTNPVHTGDR